MTSGTAGPRSRGTVCTFYSYKGGVGRTLALANVAVLLAQWGYRVLCVDWDLEAPGLHLYYEHLDPARTPGVVELVEGLHGAGPVRWREHTTAVAAPGTGDRLWMMPAGDRDSHYFGRMQDLDWESLYRDHGLGEVLEALRAEWTDEYDFVLIDSRTGVTDIGGICTVQLPDIVAFLFTPNRQSVEGSLDIMSRAEARRDELPVDRAKLLGLPVVTRWEANVEVDLGRQWLERLEVELKPAFASWAHKSLAPGDLLNHTRLPYVPRWSFGEELPVITEGTTDRFSLGYALETLAALIANKLEHTDLLTANRESYVDTAKFAKVTGTDRYHFDVQVLGERGNVEFAQTIARVLGERHWRVQAHTTPERGEEIELGSVEPGSVITARNLVVVLSQAPSRRVESEVREFLRKTLIEDDDWRLLVPVALGPPSEVMPRPLRSFRYIDATAMGTDAVVGHIEVLLEEQLADRLAASVGPDHPATVAARARHVLGLLAVDDLSTATPLLGPVVREAASVLGGDHDLTRKLVRAFGTSRGGTPPPETGSRPQSREVPIAEREGSSAEPGEPIPSIRGGEGARLIALNMALSGSPREEISRYLSANFVLDDQEGLLDEVFQRVRERK